MTLEKEFSNMSLLDSDTDYSGFLKVLSIDVGVQHLGLSLALVNKDDYTFDRIVDINLVDITKFTHNVCDKGHCKLLHTKTFYDWLTHVFVEHLCFEQADVILIERQPPRGFVVVEQVIFGKYREKSWLISPNSIHKYMSIGHLDYEGRKLSTVNMAKKYFTEELKFQLSKYDREHDVADSVCQILYWCDKRTNEYRLEQRKNSFNLKNIDCIKFLESFRYKKCLTLFT